MIQRLRAELEASNEALRRKTIALEEVIATAQRQKEETVRAVLAQVEQLMPLVRRLREQAAPPLRPIVDNVERSVRAILEQAPAAKEHSKPGNLTPCELRICQFIREGCTSKEIAKAEGISVETVETHRRNIRRKLNLRSSRVQLGSYLRSRSVADR